MIKSDISHSALPSLRAQLYDLYGVLVHHGHSVNSGHYLCYVKASSGTWLVCDDSRVATVSEKMILSQNAYMLFYVRRTSRVPGAAAAATSLVRSAALAAQQQRAQGQQQAAAPKPANASIPTVATQPKTSKVKLTLAAAKPANSSIPTVAERPKTSEAGAALTAAAATEEAGASEQQASDLPVAKRRKLLDGVVPVIETAAAVPTKKGKRTQKKAEVVVPALASGTQPAALPLLLSIKVPTLKRGKASSNTTTTAPTANGHATTDSKQAETAAEAPHSPTAAAAAKSRAAGARTGSNPASVYEHPSSPTAAAAAAQAGANGVHPHSPPVAKSQRQQSAVDGMLSPRWVLNQHSCIERLSGWQ